MDTLYFPLVTRRYIFSNISLFRSGIRRTAEVLPVRLRCLLLCEVCQSPVLGATRQQVWCYHHCLVVGAEAAPAALLRSKARADETVRCAQPFLCAEKSSSRWEKMNGISHSKQKALMREAFFSRLECNTTSCRIRDVVSSGRANWCCNFAWETSEKKHWLKHRCGDPGVLAVGQRATVFWVNVFSLCSFQRNQTGFVTNYLFRTLVEAESLA